MIELNEETHVLGIWMVGAPKHGFDWLGVVLKPEGGTWKAVYRFRYHVDDKTHDSADRKSWYTMETDSKDREAGEHLRRTFGVVTKRLAEESGGELHHLPCDCDGVEAAKRLSLEEWAHFKIEAPDG